MGVVLMEVLLVVMVQMAQRRLIVGGIFAGGEAVDAAVAVAAGQCCVGAGA